MDLILFLAPAPRLEYNNNMPKRRRPKHPNLPLKFSLWDVADIMNLSIYGLYAKLKREGQDLRAMSLREFILFVTTYKKWQHNTKKVEEL